MREAKGAVAALVLALALVFPLAFAGVQAAVADDAAEHAAVSETQANPSAQAALQAIQLDESGVGFDAQTDATGLSPQASAKLAGQFEADLYLPSSTLASVPTAVQKATAQTFAELAEEVKASVRPQALLVRVVADSERKDGFVLCSADGQTRYECTLYEFAQAVEPYVVPAFWLVGDDAADAFGVRAKKCGLADAFVIGEASSIDIARSYMPKNIALLDCTGSALADASAASKQMLAAREAGAIGIVADSGAVGKGAARFLRERGLGVWMDAGDASGDPARLHGMVTTGASGVVLTSCQAYYDLLARYKLARSLAFSPGVIGHRGTSNAALAGSEENTLTAFDWVLAQGARGFEADVWLVDGVLVVSHEQPKSRKDCLRLETVLKRYAARDVLVHLDLKLDASLSEAGRIDYSATLSKKLAKLFAKYPAARDNVVLISNRTLVLQAVGQNEALSWAACEAYGKSSLTKLPAAVKALANWRAVLRPYSPSFASTHAALFDGLGVRGLVGGHPYSDWSALDRAFTFGRPVITTGTAERSATYASDVVLSSGVAAGVPVARLADSHQVVQFSVGALAHAVTWSGAAPSGVSYSLVSLDGNVRTSGSALYLDAETAQVAVACTQRMPNGSTYTIYSPAITLHAVTMTESNRTSVKWANHDGSVLAETTLYVGADASGKWAINPTPTYAGQKPKRAPSAKAHFTYSGWKRTSPTTQAGVGPLETSTAGKTVVYTATYSAEKHVLGEKASCTHAQKCLKCGYVKRAKLGHSYRAGICKRCGKVKAASRVTLKSFTAKGSAATVKWAKKKGASGYQVAYRMKGEKTWKTVKVSKAKRYRTFKNLDRGRYQVRVRCYLKVHGKPVYGKWSSRLAVTVRP